MLSHNLPGLSGLSTTPIIGAVQTAYMIHLFQSEDAVRHQRDHKGHLYYLLISRKTYAGYLAVRRELETSSMFLSKFYVAKSFWGRGFARQALSFLETFCRSSSLTTIHVTVNKRNVSSLAVYERLGFARVRDVVTDIGNGFFMDDFVMEKNL